jgi:hypothetical protein
MGSDRHAALPSDFDRGDLRFSGSVRELTAELSTRFPKRKYTMLRGCPWNQGDGARPRAVPGHFQFVVLRRSAIFISFLRNDASHSRKFACGSPRIEKFAFRLRLRLHPVPAWREEQREGKLEARRFPHRIYLLPSLYELASAESNSPAAKAQPSPDGAREATGEIC